MKWKLSRNDKKRKYSNEEKLALGENENTSTHNTINIAQEESSNIFDLLQKLVKKQSSIYDLNMF